MVDLFVGGSADLFMSGRLDCLVLHSRGRLLMDSSIVMSRLSLHVVDGDFGRVKGLNLRGWEDLRFVIDLGWGR